MQYCTFFTELVRFDEYKVLGNMYDIHSIIPAIIMDFSMRSRVHSGLRLMNQAARYIIYPQESKLKMNTRILAIIKDIYMFR